MKLTNKLGLPQPIVTALENDEYSRGAADISASSLWKAPRIVTLEEAHAADLVVDAADQIWSLFGTAFHALMEKHTKDAVSEHRLFMPCEGWVISGQLDRFVISSGTIEDWKVTSAFAVKNLSRSHEWEQQLNTYAHLLRHAGHTVNRLRVHAVLRDWNMRSAQMDSTYPQSQIVTVDLPLWTPEDAETKIRAQVRLQQEARINLPECSPEDRWLKPSKVAVMKDGRKTAVKLFDTQAEAESFLSAQADKGKLYTQSRPGEAIRCASYCAVGRSGFCSQWNADPLNKKETVFDPPETNHPS